MQTIIHYDGKDITIMHTEEKTSCSFLHNGNFIELEVIGAANNKKAREIYVSVVKIVKDSSERLLTSARVDYMINKPAEYLMFYNIPTVEDHGLGFTEYMHALNGAFARCEELGGTKKGQGFRPFNSDGTIKEIPSENS
jgi:hypothetical protein